MLPRAAGVTRNGFVNFISPSELGNSAKLGVTPASHTLLSLGGLAELMNKWETLVCLEGGQRGSPRYPQGCPSPGQGYSSETPQQEANDACTAQRVKEKQLELRLEDQKYLPDTLRLL